jgi:hypothetical protein
MSADTASHVLGLFPFACIIAILLLGVIAWLMWLGRKWDRSDVLPPPRRQVRRPGSVPEYPR